MGYKQKRLPKQRTTTNMRNAIENGKNQEKITKQHNKQQTETMNARKQIITITFKNKEQPENQDSNEKNNQTQVGIAKHIRKTSTNKQHKQK